MQVIEQLFLMVVYLFWALVFGFLLIAWRPGGRRNARPVVPVTGQKNKKIVEDCDEGIENPSAVQGDTSGSRE